MTATPPEPIPDTGPGDFVAAVRGVARAVVSNAVGAMPRLRWAKVATAAPLTVRYLDDRTTGAAAALRPYAPTVGDIALVAAFAGYVIALGTTAPQPGGGNGGIPVATVLTWAGGSGRPIPAGWLLCDGAAVSRTTYADLFREVGVTYGNGNGSTTFNLPNYKKRVPVGLADAGAFGAVGQTGGAETHTLTVAEMPAHTHKWSTSTGGEAPLGWNGVNYATRANSDAYYTQPDTTAVGDGAPHNNLPPYITQRFIIKT